jgi:hypothetical protein
VSLLRSTWERWKQFAHAVGVVQTRGLMLLLYALVAVPTGFFMRLSGDRLRLKHQKDGNWVPHRQEEQSIDTARRQF